MFDALGTACRRDGYRGCAFINAAAEIADPGHPARAAVREHKRLCGEYLGELLRDAGRAGTADDDAAALLLIMEGAMVSALIERDPAPAARARAVAAGILDHPTPREDR
jgi:hypothetical protein